MKGNYHDGLKEHNTAVGMGIPLAIRNVLKTFIKTSYLTGDTQTMVKLINKYTDNERDIESRIIELERNNFNA